MFSLPLLRRINLVMSGIGLAVFAALLAYVNLAQEDFGERIGEILVSQTSEQVSLALEQKGIATREIDGSSGANRALEGIKERIDLGQDSLDADLDRVVADVLVAQCKIDCERREQITSIARDYMENSIARWGMASANLEQLILGKYEEVVQSIRTDLTIFAASNALLLAFAFLLSLFRQNAARHLLPIAAILSVSTLAMALWYVLGQNWIMTIIFSDYWGWCYPIIQALLALLLLDIALNSGRVTGRIFRLAGGVGSSVPC